MGLRTRGSASRSSTSSDGWEGRTRKVTDPKPQGYPQEELFGTVILHGDVVGPVLPADAWNAERGELD